MSDPRRLLLVLALLPALGSGCINPGSDDYALPAREIPSAEGWVVSEPFPCTDFDVLWETAKAHACRIGRGWRIDDDHTTYSKKRIVTAWNIELGMHRNDGRRRRRFVEFEEVKDPKGFWKVRVATVRQRNADIDDPSNPANAEWKADAPDLEDAEMVAFRIESQFRAFGPSREFELR
jgi:hypothetical protein